VVDAEGNCVVLVPGGMFGIHRIGFRAMAFLAATRCWMARDPDGNWIGLSQRASLTASPEP
jgi:hypothetical protein